MSDENIASGGPEAVPPVAADEATVPDETVRCGSLPPLKWRDLPEPISWKKMVGPSIMLAGLALGSGEFVIWPYITYKAGFIFFWACILGVITQYFLNMEIERWTLATG
ncbi:MAG: Nramp family divalent metal transporter, partial [Planctomycetota bacterium]|nr:Nramp family divalent metal transporter [Planctomycetota bacterium]